MIQRIPVLFFSRFIETAHETVLTGNNAELIALAANRIRQIINQKAFFIQKKSRYAV